MRAIIYLRVSTDEQASSVDTQEAVCRAHCDRAGLAVVDVIRDVGHSGAEWVTRPGIVALQAAARETPRPWDVVVTRDADRLGRDAVRLPLLLSDLRDVGVAVVEASTGRALELDGMGLVISSVRAALAQVERETIARRTRVAHEAQHRAGRVVGGRVYGYRNVRGVDGVRYEVDAAEAAVVREIFGRRAAGESLRGIARDLNSRGIPGPRGGSWSASSIRDLLERERYHGVLTWGEAGTAYRGGTQVRTRGGDVVRVEAPALALVDTATWHAAQPRPGALRGPSSDRRGVAPRHLLVGLAVCDACGGPVGSDRTKSGRATIRAYACLHARERGPSACTSRWRIPAERIEATVLDWLAGEVLDPERVAAAVEEAERQAARPPAADERTEALRAEERETAAAVARLTLAVETADDVPALVARLRERSARLREVRAELARVLAPRTPLGDAGEELRALAADLRGVLQEDPAGAREVLAAVLVERIRVRVDVLREGRGRGRVTDVTVTGAADRGRVLRAPVTGGLVASPAGSAHTPRLPVELRRRVA